MQQGNDIAQLVRLEEYQEARKHIFPSKGSLEWYLRQHRDELIAAGALLKIAGQWHAQLGRFDTTVLELGTRAAQRRPREEA